MTGTADTEAEEFAKIYNLDVVVVPTNQHERPQGRGGRRLQDRAREVRRGRARRSRSCHEKGQPVLVGTVSVAKSEVVSTLLKTARRPAQRPEREAPPARGRDRRAGGPQGRGHHLHQHGRPRHRHPPRRQPRDDGEARGRARSRTRRWRARPTEAFLAPHARSGRGGSPRRAERLKAQTAAEHEEVVALGGLHILGTERHESRRIDNQLRGRAGRQGDPGSSMLLPVPRGRPDAHLRVRAHPGADGARWA